MLSFVLAVALATPCLAPPKAPYSVSQWAAPSLPAKHKHHKAHIMLALQSCVIPPPAILTPTIEEIPAPTVVTRYVLADALPAVPVPVVYYDAPVVTPAGDEWWLYAGSGGGYVAPTCCAPVPAKRPPPGKIDPRLPPHTGSTPPPYVGPPPHPTPEMDAGTGLSACLMLGGILAVIRGKRS